MRKHIAVMAIIAAVSGGVVAETASSPIPGKPAEEPGHHESQRGPILVGIAIGAGATAAWFAVDKVFLESLYYGIGVASVDDTPVADDDIVTRASWLLEDYVDFNADQNLLDGHAHEERHYWLVQKRWSALYPIKEWTRAIDGHKAERGWELRRKGRIIAKGSARSAPALAGPIWSFRPATRDETRVDFSLSIDLRPENMSIQINGSTATVSFSQGVRDFVAAPNPAALSWGLNSGVDVATTDVPSSFEIPILDVRWEIDSQIALSATGKTDDELRREAIAGAVRLVAGERAGGGWTPPANLAFSINDITIDSAGAYRVDRTTSVYINDLIQAEGFDGLYIYDYVGPGEPDATTPLPTNIPADGTNYTLAGSESGGAYAEDNGPVGETTGACCSYADTGCVEVPEDACEATFEGTYLGDGSTCLAGGCAVLVRGACCGLQTDGCADAVRQEDCEFVFSANVECANTNDGDGDGVDDVCDSCPLASDPGQEDTDGDGVGDVCDPCTDTDGDGFGNTGFPANTCPDDNCPSHSSTTQTDGDGDGVGDICDNCPFDSNPGQEDVCGNEPTITGSGSSTWTRLITVGLMLGVGMWIMWRRLGS